MIQFREGCRLIFFVIRWSIVFAFCCKELDPYDIILSEAVDSGEEFVEDDMELRTDVAALEIAHEADGRRMLLAEAKELSASGLRSPFWNFLAILQRRAEDISRTAPDSCALETLAGNGSAAEELNGSKAGDFVGCVIVEPTSIVQSKRPELNLKFFGPVKEGMLHHGTGFLSDSAYATFRDTVLVVRADT